MNEWIKWTSESVEVSSLALLVNTKCAKQTKSEERSSFSPCFKNGTIFCEIIEQKNIILFLFSQFCLKIINSFQMYEPEF